MHIIVRATHWNIDICTVHPQVKSTISALRHIPVGSTSSTACTTSSRHPCSSCRSRSRLISYSAMRSATKTSSRNGSIRLSKSRGCLRPWCRGPLLFACAPARSAYRVRVSSYDKQCRCVCLRATSKTVCPSSVRLKCAQNARVCVLEVGTVCPCLCGSTQYKVLLCAFLYVDMDNEYRMPVFLLSVITTKCALDVARLCLHACIVRAYRAAS
jgi:hypothetical protein